MIDANKDKKNEREHKKLKFLEEEFTDLNDLVEFYHYKTIVERLRKELDSRNPIEDKDCTCEECRTTKLFHKMLDEKGQESLGGLSY